MSSDDPRASYHALGPDAVLGAVEALGWRPDGRLLALSSYENRVYQIGVEDAAPVVAKFYRPARWSDEAILEEHAYTLALAALEVPVVAPLAEADGRTLHRRGVYRFAVYPRQGGRPPELDDLDQLEQLGRFLGRIHALGEVRAFSHRPTLDVEQFGVQSYRYLLEHGWLPVELELSYRTLAEDLLLRIEACYARAGPVRYIRLHGDCHPGNVLWTDAGPHIVDFDDARMGPAIQDLWMLLSGDRRQMTVGLDAVLEGYTQFRGFDARELNLVEALRTLRMMHYAAWLARRWSDPAFPRAFPWFNERRYWDEHILSLREQAALMEEPPLQWS